MQTFCMPLNKFIGASQNYNGYDELNVDCDVQNIIIVLIYY